MTKLAEERESWDSKLGFIFSCVGYAIGLGNIWRFPYLCYKNGGGAFLIPYVLALIFGGLPMFFLEGSIGQYTSIGGISVWEKITPSFKGVGYAALMIAFWSNSYYIIVLAWNNFYLYNSFTMNALPWTTCDNFWNTDKCITSLSIKHSNVSSDLAVTSADEFWLYRVLKMTSGIEDQGGMRWELVTSLLVTWIIIYFCIWRGVKWTGKIVYFTSMFPYIMLTILLVRGLTLPGAFEGIKYLFIPKWELLLKSEVWIDAVTQIFWSYGLGVGAVIALGSYNKFNNNIYKDSLYLVAVNEGTSLISGLVIFSILGFMAHSTGKHISEVASSGPGLIFVAYPNAMAELPFSNFWNIAFYIMILFVGLDTQFCTVEGFITAVTDEWPVFKRHREFFVAIVCGINFFIGLSCLTEGGIYTFNIFNTYAVSGWSFLGLMFFECIAVSWVYGIGRFSKNIYEMTNVRLGIFWKISFVVATPLLCVMVSLFSIFKHEPLTYKDYVYPWWGEVIGIAMTFSSVSWIPLYAIYRYIYKQCESDETMVEKDYDKEIHFEKKQLNVQLSSRKKLLDSEIEISL